MSASKLQESGDVRIAHSLHTKEEEFVVKRREIVFQSLQKHEIHCSQNKVPHIALLSSGGGQRATVGLLECLVQLDKAGLLDCILYLSGVSGSTWCMASLYQEPDWSTKLETVKDNIIKRLSGPGVSWGDAFAKLKKYYNGKDFFSLTDIWAAIVVTTYMKEIDEHTLTDKWSQLGKDPFPIYTATDKQSKQEEGGDPWFEISPHEAGYSLSGAFVETSNFGSQFDNGSKKKHQAEIDMLYLQALCGSALAGEDSKEFIWGKIQDFLKHSRPTKEIMFEEMKEDPNSPPVEKWYQVLMDLVDMNLCVLNVKDPSALDQSIRTMLNDLSGGKSQLIDPMKTLETADKRAEKRYIKRFTIDVCEDLNSRTKIWLIDAGISICKCMAQWIWGRKYNFLHNMTDEAVHSTILQSETRDYIDAGLLQNSPFFSVLREERDIDLIISLDFSQGDPFMTVRNAAETCKTLNIPFPEVTSGDKMKPKDFYVFKGQNSPTVIHIPLFNVVNCGDKVEDLRKKYRTFQDPYSAEMIADLMEVAGKNISNNREKLKEQIAAVIEEKRFSRFNTFLNKDSFRLNIE
ncbi:cytosolic phospholipase A2 gamma-like isoform X2 [Sinocyclocheilus grahami]|uniref:cytosolic phospholipase A2 gamma-like isoform X2 n=1 Tax=Sinocyclocheilus grahami TaxID=75366 RepID=UPI0007ACD3EF|nr:PREDICTED: cytosolic phospholipase A2 gamma-like isoform X2 [Sinocyclocheilus grahami]